MSNFINSYHSLIFICCERQEIGVIKLSVSGFLAGFSKKKNGSVTNAWEKVCVCGWYLYFKRQNFMDHRFKQIPIVPNSSDREVENIWLWIMSQSFSAPLDANSIGQRSWWKAIWLPVQRSAELSPCIANHQHICKTQQVEKSIKY